VRFVGLPLPTLADKAHPHSATRAGVWRGISPYPSALGLPQIFSGGRTEVEASPVPNRPQEPVGDPLARFAARPLLPS
jgi:hypothetical protein